MTDADTIVLSGRCPVCLRPVSVSYERKKAGDGFTFRLADGAYPCHKECEKEYELLRYARSIGDRAFRGEGRPCHAEFGKLR